jgi:hypothetical protein
MQQQQDICVVGLAGSAAENIICKLVGQDGVKVTGILDQRPTSPVIYKGEQAIRASRGRCMRAILHSINRTWGNNFV